MAKKTSQKKRCGAAKRSSPTQAKTQTIDLGDLPIEQDPALRLTWVDRMNIAYRADIPVVTLRFYSALKDQLCEASRLQTSVPHLRQIVDVICRAIDYYPKKPEA